VTQLIAAFRNFSNPSKTAITFVISSSPSSYLLSTILSLFSYVLFILHIVSVNLFRFIDPSNFFRVFLVTSFFLHFISFFIYSCLLRPKRKVSEGYLLILFALSARTQQNRECWTCFPVEAVTSVTEEVLCSGAVQSGSSSAPFRNIPTSSLTL